jgi:hypothetical protein
LKNDTFATTTLIIAGIDVVNEHIPENVILIPGLEQMLARNQKGKCLGEQC